MASFSYLKGCTEVSQNIRNKYRHRSCDIPFASKDDTFARLLVIKRPKKREKVANELRKRLRDRRDRNYSTSSDRMLRDFAQTERQS